MNALPLHAGEKFGRLTVLDILPAVRIGNQSVRQIGVRCDCGQHAAVRPTDLVRGKTKSCGCLQREKASNSGKLRRKAPGEAATNCVFNSYKQAARSRSLPFELSREQVAGLIFDTCRYCGCGPQNLMSRKTGMFGAIRYNGIDRVDNSEGYTVKNCVTACEMCNKAKRTMDAADFIVWVNRVHDHMQHSPFTK